MDYLPCDQCPHNYLCRDGNDCPSVVSEDSESDPWENFVPERFRWHHDES